MVKHRSAYTKGMTNHLSGTGGGEAGRDGEGGTASLADQPRDKALRVLVVEDLPRVQALLRELINESDRLEVTAIAETEAEAVQQYVALRPDAVVIDLNLRQGTGLGVIMALRRDSQGARPLLIVLTNHALPVLEAACLNAGADYFLDKSRDFHKVRTLLEHAYSNTTSLPAPAVAASPLPGAKPH
jgi:two-component system, OmpR family, response regulator